VCLIALLFMPSLANRQSGDVRAACEDASKRPRRLAKILQPVIGS
jgi:hypothetical protein